MQNLKLERVFALLTDCIVQIPALLPFRIANRLADVVFEAT
jgi:hypothetical protein